LKRIRAIDEYIPSSFYCVWVAEYLSESWNLTGKKRKGETMIPKKLGALVMLAIFFTSMSAFAEEGEWIKLIHEAQMKYNYGLYDQAEQLDTKALELAEQEGDPKQVHVSVTLNNLGMVLKAKRQYMQAELLFKRALEISERTYGPNSVLITADLTNLAFLYMEQGQYETAEPYFKRPLEICEKAFPQGNSETLGYMSNLAYFYRKAHRTQEAEEIEKRIAAIRSINK
jgi:tetratricopeptide (TPR) repeat protein